MEVADVDLDQVMYKMDNFGQDFVVNDNLHGRVSGTLRIDARVHPDLVPDLAHTSVVADLTVLDGRLANFGPMQAMADFMVVMGMMERRGTGFPRMRRAMQAFNGSEPELVQNRAARWVRVILFR